MNFRLSVLETKRYAAVRAAEPMVAAAVADFRERREASTKDQGKCAK